MNTHDNPYRQPLEPEVLSSTEEINVSHSMAVRVLTGGSSTLAIAGSLGACIVWGIMNCYQVSENDIQAQLFLWISILLLLIAIYHFLFTLFAYKFVPTAIHLPILFVSNLVAIPTFYIAMKILL